MSKSVIDNVRHLCGQIWPNETAENFAGKRRPNWGKTDPGQPAFFGRAEDWAGHAGEKNTGWMWVKRTRGR